MTTNAEALLSGPRGRRLCLKLARALDADIDIAVFCLGYDLDPGRGTSRVTATSDDDGAPTREHATVEQLMSALSSLDPASLGEDRISAALERSVQSAAYWQRPDGEDTLAGVPGVMSALSPLAERVVGTQSTQWWGKPRRDEQWAINWRHSDAPVALPKEPLEILAAWARGVRAEEAQAASEHPHDPAADCTGSWWSIPAGVFQTVGQIPSGLRLVEDSHDAEHATTIPIRGRGTTFEIRSAEDWASLCRAHPLEVTASRRHDWFRATGRDGRWVIPDWESVAGEWDAVHLTALAYLGGAARAIPVNADTASVIAGWDPDATIWLTGAAEEAEGPREAWHRAEHDAPWTPGRGSGRRA